MPSKGVYNEDQKSCTLKRTCENHLEHISDIKCVNLNIHNKDNSKRSMSKQKENKEKEVVLHLRNKNRRTKREIRKIQRSINNNIDNEESDDEVIKKINESAIFKSEKIKLIRLIGKGGFSKIFLCLTEKKVGKKYAAKLFLRDKNSKKEDFENYIKKEYYLQKTTRGKYVTNTCGLFHILNQEDNSNGNDCQWLMITELELNGDLNHFKNKKLRLKTFNNNLIIYYGGQIVKSLEHLHSVKICHLDLKMNNIFINGNNDAKISDFSISVDYSKMSTYKLTGSGTHKFISPETIKKEVLDTKDLHKVDFWSLGVILYYLSVGKYPYELNEVDTTSNEDLQKILKNTLDFGTEHNLSISTKDFITRLLEKDYNKRISMEEVKNHDFMKNFSEILNYNEYYGDKDKYIQNLINEQI